MNKKKVLSFGEILWDVYPDKKHIGGAPLNFAAHFVKCGGEAFVNSAVGNDALGDLTVNSVNDLGVNTKYIFKNDKQTGQCLVTLDKDSIPSYNLLDDTAYDFIDSPDCISENFDVFYFGTLALRNEYNRKSVEKILNENDFDDVFVDINIRKPFISKEVIEFALKYATILKISDEDLAEFAHFTGIKYSSPLGAAKEISKRFKNIKLILITMGEVGSLAFECKAQNETRCNAQKVKVASTVGAGDSFSAAFLAMYLNGSNIQTCLETASKVSGFVVSNMGAIPDYTI